MSKSKILVPLNHHSPIFRECLSASGSNWNREKYVMKLITRIMVYLGPLWGDIKILGHLVC